MGHTKTKSPKDGPSNPPGGSPIPPQQIRHTHHGRPAACALWGVGGWFGEPGRSTAIASGLSNACFHGDRRHRRLAQPHKTHQHWPKRQRQTAITGNCRCLISCLGGIAWGTAKRHCLALWLVATPGVFDLAPCPICIFSREQCHQSHRWP